MGLSQAEAPILLIPLRYANASLGWAMADNTYSEAISTWLSEDNMCLLEASPVKTVHLVAFY